MPVKFNNKPNEQESFATMPSSSNNNDTYHSTYHSSLSFNQSPQVDNELSQSPDTHLLDSDDTSAKSFSSQNLTNLLNVSPASIEQAVASNRAYWFGEKTQSPLGTDTSIDAQINSQTHAEPILAREIDEAHIEVLERASEFAYQVWEAKQTACQAFLASYPLTDTLTAQNIADLIDDYTLDEYLERADEAGVMTGLRHLRQLLMMRWIWQDALQVISLEKLTEELSDFAISALNFAKYYVWGQLVARYGIPQYKNGVLDNILDRPSALSQSATKPAPKSTASATDLTSDLSSDLSIQPYNHPCTGDVCMDDMAILAMGKLGAGELNLSSDIDLIFVHCAQGETNGSKEKGTKSIDNKRFMIRLGQGIIKLLDTKTADGFVFRVDMRLRPWGDGSDLAVHLAALEKYFTKHGRAWERFAWLKAKIVNPISPQFEDALQALIKPFVFRYYVDYSTFAALREMKTLIQNQVAQREDLDNVKLGAGGIRDIEFVVQAFQLIYGGRYRQLQVKSNLKAMRALYDFGFLEEQTYYDLQSAYRFLRRTEHAIQAINDQQTQKLPLDPKWQQNLALTLGFTDWLAFMKTLNNHRLNVSIPFDRMVTMRQTAAQSQEALIDDFDDALENLTPILTDENKDKLSQFLNSKLVNNLTPEAKARLDAAMPILAHALIKHEDKQGLANVALPRLLTLLEAICRRSIYLVMLTENPNATVDLIPMLSASPWIANELARYPVLLDSFLQQRYRHLPDKAELEDILRQRLLRVEPDDEETLLSVLRLFKNNQVLAVAASDVLAERPIMKVSDSLTMIAEVVLNAALMRAFASVIARHGYPVNKQGNPVSEANNGFAVIGYGKLGGNEMSYTSDLDLVFIHQIDEKLMSTGENAISGMQFSTKLARKLMNYLNTHTRDGRAYEIDMRLRPSGNAGMMVVSSRAFERYQLDKAWVWEHQALVRARPICGDIRVQKAFNNIRKEVLSKPRDLPELRTEVSNMRAKMQDSLGTSKHIQEEGKFHLKQDFGALVDIEFMAQYAVLAYAHEHPELLKWSDNVHIFEVLGQTGLWPPEDCETLIYHYLKIRAAMHQLALANEDIIVDSNIWQKTREFIQTQWQAMIGARQENKE